MEKVELARALKKYTLGPAELIASYATGTVASPIAGWSGILATTKPDGPSGGDVASKLQERLTYSPRSELSTELAGDLAGLVPDWVKAAADKYSEVSGAVGEESPVAGAALDTLPTALGLLVPYASRVKSLGQSVPDSALNRQAGILRGLSDEEALLHPGVAELKKWGGSESPMAPSIWNEYGVGEMPGIPGKYFDEIDDSAATFSHNDLPVDKNTRLSNLLKHPELYKNVPPMRFAEVTSTPGIGGWWDLDNMRMGVGDELDAKSALNVAIHEAQHGTAQLTDLPQGTTTNQAYKFYGNVIKQENKKAEELLRRLGVDESFADDVRKDPNSPYRDLVNTEAPEWKAYTDTKDYLRLVHEARDNEYQKYHDNYGEAIARMAEARKNMSAYERRESYPFDESNFRRQTRSELSDVLRNYRGE